MVTKEIIDEVLTNHEDIKQSLLLIAKKYRVKDFVLMSRQAKDYFNGCLTADIDIYAYLLNQREKYLLINTDRVEERLLKEYIGFIGSLIKTCDEDNIVFYIIAYHYLMMCKEIAYILLKSKNSPFPSLAWELSPRGKEKLNKYRDTLSDIGYHGFDLFSERDLLFYNSIFYELKCHSSQTKQFSILAYYLEMITKINQYRFNDSFICIVDLFIFRYRVIYTEKQLGLYAGDKEMMEIIRDLTDYSL